MSKNDLFVGVERPFIWDIKHELQHRIAVGADYFSVPLFHPRLRRDDIGISDARLGCLTRSDRELESREWIVQIMGKLSEWIDLDAIDAATRDASLRSLREELQWAAHLSLQAVLIPTPRLNAQNYACRIMQQSIGGTGIAGFSFQQIFVRIPLVLPLSQSYLYHDTTSSNISDGSEYCKDGWEVWDRFRRCTGDNNKLFVALELNKDTEDEAASLSSLFDEKEEGTTVGANSNLLADINLHRWKAEPVKVLIIRTNLFRINQQGYPVLAKCMQRIVSALLLYCNQILFVGAPHGREPPQEVVVAPTAPPSSLPPAPGPAPGPAPPSPLVPLPPSPPPPPGLLLSSKNSSSNTSLVTSAVSSNSGNKDATTVNNKNMSPPTYTYYTQYIRYLLKKARDEEIQALKRKGMLDASSSSDGSSYDDTLQAPLQPLMDNLESQTYETFERDPVKYQLYEQAIARALEHLALQQQQQRREGEADTRDEANADIPVGAESCDVDDNGDDANGGNGANTNVSAGDSSSSSGVGRGSLGFVVTVVGAGRGPLVAAALSASAATGVPLRALYAVEKNRNAVITLRNRAVSERWSSPSTQVHIVASDMRDWRPPEPCDILVSELLGSWGDNELSPECLDGAQRQGCMKKAGAISIPQSYTSYLAPLASTALWSSAKAMSTAGVGMAAAGGVGGQLNSLGISDGLDTPFVVKFRHCYEIADPQPLFHFIHPNPALEQTTSAHTAASSSSASLSPSSTQDVACEAFKKRKIENPTLRSTGSNDNINSGSIITSSSLRTSMRNNTRYGVVSFTSKVNMVMHGMAGYFESTLFDSNDTTMKRTADTPPADANMNMNTNATSTSSNRVLMSILPSTHSPGMFSWFPLFIPLQQPVRLRVGDTITCHVWRCADERRVWYEWCLSSPIQTPIQNSQGKHYSVGLH